MLNVNSSQINFPYTNTKRNNSNKKQSIKNLPPPNYNLFTFNKYIKQGI